RTIAASLDLATIRKHWGRSVRAILARGQGANGKDTLREAVSLMYGRQGLTGATINDFAQYDQGRKFPLSKLVHSRVNWASENASFSKLDGIQSLKAWITGDPIDIEKKGVDDFAIEPVAVGIFNCNDAPRLSGVMEAIASRYAVLTFSKTYKTGADPEKGEIEADPRFKYDPDFMRNEVMPAFLNQVLAALVALMQEGIDYQPCDEALAEIRRSNCHLWEFCQDVGLDYQPGASVTAGEIWEKLETWYQANGTLEYEENEKTGKRKAIWFDQANRFDSNVKGANQVLARFQELFPKTKRGMSGEKQNKPALYGLGFSGSFSATPGSSQAVAQAETRMVVTSPGSHPSFDDLREISEASSPEMQQPKNQIESENRGDCLGMPENQGFQPEKVAENLRQLPEEKSELPKPEPKPEKFKVGDKVLVRSDSGMVYAGKIGTIVALYSKQADIKIPKEGEPKHCELIYLQKLPSYNDETNF
ncbi:MAG: DUF5906 domain-containing protein, partial [Actinomycetota bacterium]